MAVNRPELDEVLPSHPTLVHLLRQRADDRPQRVAYCFRHEDGRTDRLTHADLDLRARAVGRELAALGASGRPVLLLHPPGPEYVTAFFGCLYAGAVAVPAYLPDPAHLARSLARLEAVVVDAGPAAVLTTGDLRAGLAPAAAAVPQLARLPLLATDELPDDGSPAADWSPPPVTPDTPALLQYTSGSTSRPRGVVLRHARLLRNSEVIKRFFGTSESSHAVIWLPPYHDMGLIGGILQPLYAGFPATLMAPADFLREPLRWLRAISETRATVSGGPNFAYDLCVRRTTPRQRADLDLSCWQVAFNGAEPVRPDTLRRFAEAFEPAGFRADAFHPCYGLAEATLLVTGGRSWRGPGHGRFDAEALRSGRGVPAGPADAGPADAAAPGAVRHLVSCGRVSPGHRLVVVDPDDGREREPGQVGEIWVGGPDVANAYWGRPGETRETFQARLGGDPDGTPFLRTGDLGFTLDGELFVTGRLRDLLVVRGQNHYPQDVELTAERAAPALRAGCGAAFTVEADDAADGAADDADDADDGLAATRVVLVHEVTRDAAGDAAAQVERIAAEVRAAVARDHALTLHDLVLIPPGALPKTSSGKVRRSRCAAMLAAGELPVLARSALRSDPPAPSPAPPAAPPDPDRLRAMPPAGRRAVLESYLRARVAAAGGVAPDRVALDAPLLALGLDSLGVVGVQQAVRTDLAVGVTVSELADAASLAELAARLDERVTAAAPAGTAGTDDGPPAGTVRAPVSYGQASLWFLQELRPASAAHNIAVALRLRGGLDADAFAGAVDDLVARHAALRTTFPAPGGEPVQDIAPTGHAGVDRHDVAGLDDAALTRLVERAANAPFDLAAGPLLRVGLFRRSADETVVLVAAHHVITDFWSMTALVRELEAGYTGRTGGPAADQPAPGADPADFAGWQRALVDGPDGERLRRYWAARLDGARPDLRLPAPAAGETPEGNPDDDPDAAGACRFRLDGDLTRRLRDRARAEGVTLSMLLLLGYELVLHRATGQDELLVGMPASGRTEPRFASLVGYCMNPVVIRSRVGRDETVRDLLARTRADVLGAVEHQDYPLHLLAGDRGEHRPFRAMFVHNRPPVPGEASLAVLSTGYADRPRPFAGLEAEAFPLDRQATSLDVELTTVEADDVVLGQFRFRTRVLDRATAGRLMTGLVAVLDDLAADPARPAAALTGELRPAAAGPGEVAPSPRRTAAPDADRAPATGVEEFLAATFAEVLGVARIGVHDNFFDHGGHSLLATKVVARVRQRYQVPLPLRSVFEHPTVASLASLVPDGASVAPPVPAAEPARAQLAPIPAVPRDRALPLSFVQERIWLLQKLAPDSTVYNVPRALRVRGDFDPEILTAVFADLEQRHELLRTTFPEVDGIPVQVVHEPRGIPVRTVDLGDVPPSEQDDRVRELVLDAGREPFDVTTGPLIRFTLVRLGPADHVLVVVEHHLIHDGWAQGVFLRDFLELYEARMTGRPPRLPDLPVQFADVAAWQRNTFSGAELHRLLDFWTAELDGAPQVLALPTDRPHGEVLTSTGGLEELVIDDELGQALRHLGRRHGATLFMTMAAAFAGLLHHYSGQEDMLLGVGMANRQRPETENLLGMMINTLLLRVDLSGDPGFEELLGRVREHSLQMYAHQDMPFEKLVEHLNPERSLSRMPLCQVMFSFLDTPMPALEIPGLTFEVLESHNRTSKFDMNIICRPHADQRAGEVSPDLDGRVTMMTEYNADVFDRATIQRLHAHYRAVLAGAVQRPDLPVRAFLTGAVPGLPAPAGGAADDGLPVGPPPDDQAIDDEAFDADAFDDDGEYDEEDWESEYVAPRTPLEARIAEIWAEHLPAARVGVDDDFFDLGGHSLLANQVLSRLRREFDVELPLRRLFEAPTVAGLAVLVLEEQAGRVGDDDLAAILAELER